MKRSEQDRLLRDILADESVEHLRATSLSDGLAVLRARRRRRTVIAGGLASVAVAASLLVAFHRRAPAPDGPPVTPEPISRVKMITDDELLALFPNRSVALIGAPGQQQLVFLDDSSHASSRLQDE